jgi:hypothetical protein
MLEYNWEKYEEFIDEIGTKFRRLVTGEYDYEFVTRQGDRDYCFRQQLVDWNVKVFKPLK